MEKCWERKRKWQLTPLLSPPSPSLSLPFSLSLSDREQSAGRESSQSESRVKHRGLGREGQAPLLLPACFAAVAGCRIDRVTETLTYTQTQITDRTHQSTGTRIKHAHALHSYSCKDTALTFSRSDRSYKTLKAKHADIFFLQNKTSLFLCE